MDRLSVKMLVACSNANGSPELLPLNVLVTQDEYDLGYHYDAARIYCDVNGYEGPYVCFDNTEIPSFIPINVRVNLWYDAPTHAFSCDD